MSTILIKNLTNNVKIVEHYQDLLKEEFKKLEINRIKVITDEQLCEKDNITVIIASPYILKDNYSYRSPNSLWNVPFKITAIIIPEQMNNFSYRFTNLQFSPLCYIFNPSRNHIRELTYFLLNKLQFEVEVIT